MYPPARGISAANLLKHRLTALATPPGLCSHSHGFSPFCESRSSKNDGRPVQSSRHFPCAMRCFSVSQGWVVFTLFQGISGFSTRDTVTSCATAPSGSSFAMRTSRWSPVLTSSNIRQQVESVRSLSF